MYYRRHRVDPVYMPNGNVKARKLRLVVTPEQDRILVRRANFTCRFRNALIDHLGDTLGDWSRHSQAERLEVLADAGFTSRLPDLGAWSADVYGYAASNFARDIQDALKKAKPIPAGLPGGRTRSLLSKRCVGFTYGRRSVDDPRSPVVLNVPELGEVALTSSAALDTIHSVHRHPAQSSVIKHIPVDGAAPYWEAYMVFSKDPLTDMSERPDLMDDEEIEHVPFVLPPELAARLNKVPEPSKPKPLPIRLPASKNTNSDADEARFAAMAPDALPGWEDYLTKHLSHEVHERDLAKVFGDGWLDDVVGWVNGHSKRMFINSAADGEGGRIFKPVLREGV